MKKMMLMLMLMLMPILSFTQEMTKQSTDGDMPMSRSSAMLNIDNTLVLIGGYSWFGETSDAVWNSTDEGKTWTGVAQVPFGKRSGMASVIHKGAIYIIGGEGHNTADEYKRFNDVWKSSDKGKTWTQINSNPPFEEIAGAKLLSIDNNLYLIGGYTTTYSDEVWESVDDGISWQKVSGKKSFSPRTGAGVLYHDGIIYVIGGINVTKKSDFFSGFFNDLWTSEDLGRSWKRKYKKLGFPAGGRLFVNVDGRFLAIYGHGNKKDPSGLHNDIWESRDLGKTWNKIEHENFYRADFAVAPTANGFILFGGMDDTEDPERKKWWRRDTYKYTITNE